MSVKFIITNIANNYYICCYNERGNLKTTEILRSNFSSNIYDRMNLNYDIINKFNKQGIDSPYILGVDPNGFISPKTLIYNSHNYHAINQVFYLEDNSTKNDTTPMQLGGSTVAPSQRTTKFDISKAIFENDSAITSDMKDYIKDFLDNCSKLTHSLPYTTGYIAYDRYTEADKSKFMNHDKYLTDPTNLDNIDNAIKHYLTGICKDIEQIYEDINNLKTTDKLPTVSDETDVIKNIGIITKFINDLKSFISKLDKVLEFFIEFNNYLARFNIFTQDTAEKFMIKVKNFMGKVTSDIYIKISRDYNYQITVDKIADYIKNDQPVQLYKKLLMGFGIKIRIDSHIRNLSKLVKSTYPSLIELIRKLTGIVELIVTKFNEYKVQLNLQLATSKSKLVTTKLESDTFYIFTDSSILTFTEGNYYTKTGGVTGDKTIELDTECITTLNKEVNDFLQLFFQLSYTLRLSDLSPQNRFTRSKKYNPKDGMKLFTAINTFRASLKKFLSIKSDIRAITNGSKIGLIRKHGFTDDQVRQLIHAINNVNISDNPLTDLLDKFYTTESISKPDDFQTEVDTFNKTIKSDDTSSLDLTIYNTPEKIKALIDRFQSDTTTKLLDEKIEQLYNAKDIQRTNSFQGKTVQEYIGSFKIKSDKDQIISTLLDLFVCACKLKVELERPSSLTTSIIGGAATVDLKILKVDELIFISRSEIEANDLGHTIKLILGVTSKIVEEEVISYELSRDDIKQLVPVTTIVKLTSDNYYDKKKVTSTRYESEYPIVLEPSTEIPEISIPSLNISLLSISKCKHSIFKPYVADDQFADIGTSVPSFASSSSLQSSSPHTSESPVDLNKFKETIKTKLKIDTQGIDHNQDITRIISILHSRSSSSNFIKFRDEVLSIYLDTLLEKNEGLYTYMTLLDKERELYEKVLKMSSPVKPQDSSGPILTEDDKIKLRECIQKVKKYIRHFGVRTETYRGFYTELYYDTLINNIDKFYHSDRDTIIDLLKNSLEVLVKHYDTEYTTLPIEPTILDKLGTSSVTIDDGYINRLINELKKLRPEITLTEKDEIDLYEFMTKCLSNMPPHDQRLIEILPHNIMINEFIYRSILGNRLLFLYRVYRDEIIYIFSSLLKIFNNMFGSHPNYQNDKGRVSKTLAKITRDNPKSNRYNMDLLMQELELLP